MGSNRVARDGGPMRVYCADMGKARQGLTLIAISLVMAVGALVVRAQAMEDWKYDRDVRDLSNAMSRERGLTGQGALAPFNDTPYVLVGVAAALLFLAGVILYATNSETDAT